MDQTLTKGRVAPVFARSLSFFAASNGRRYFLLGAIGFLVRLPAVQGQLIWDDIYLTRENPFIKSPLLVLEAFRHYLFLDSFSDHYRPGPAAFSCT
jgi:hypothetical protein